jgi:hypothetical protein
MQAVPNMQVHELDGDVACTWMTGRGRFGRMGVQGDGSCFFHSVCALTNRDNYLFQSAAKQREIAYTFRCAFTDRFTRREYEKHANLATAPKEFAEEREGFCKPTVWADEVMIRHAASVLDINLIFLDLSSGRAYCGVHGNETLTAGTLDKVKQPTGIIAWVDRRHFEPIVRVDSADEGLITTLFEPADDPVDAELVEQVMGTYAESCALPSPRRRKGAARKNHRKTAVH